MNVVTASQVVAAGKVSQDVVGQCPHADGVVLVVADGAGGTSGGADAADAVLMWVASAADRREDLGSAATWCELLAGVDHQLDSATGGQTTAVVVNVTDAGIVGASVGDSAAWLIGPDTHTNLTVNQNRKPLIGSGCATPVPFTAPLVGTLLVASDGLIKYAGPDAICAVALRADLQTVPAKLVDLVRLQSGAVPDDVGVICARRER